MNLYYFQIHDFAVECIIKYVNNLDPGVVCNIFTCAKHLHDRTISLRGHFWEHKTSLTPTLFIEGYEPSQESER